MWLCVRVYVCVHAYACVLSFSPLRQQVLQEQEGVAVQRGEGRVGPFLAASWALWFRYTFKISQPCLVGLDLSLPGETLLKAASLVLLDNDTSQVCASFHSDQTCNFL